MNRRRWPTPRYAALTAASLLTLSLTATGCVTVHGERALIPSVRKGEAQKVLADFAEVNTAAKRALDASLVTTVETGPLGAVDEAGLRARHAGSPQGNPGVAQLELTDAHFAIPRQRGWPKWFVADTASNSSGDWRWLMVFERTSAAQPWKAAYLSVVRPEDIPEFAQDGAGYAEPVPATGSDLLVDPSRLGTAYASYLQKGKEATLVFADGPMTSGVREERRKEARTSPVVTQYADQAAQEQTFAPVALRTRAGGALVFFATHHTSKLTVGKGVKIRIQDRDTQALMTGTPRSSVTRIYAADQAATVPPATESTGKVTFLSRTVGLVAAKGE